MKDKMRSEPTSSDILTRHLVLGAAVTRGTAWELC